ncbi:glycosyltransferase family 2 protein [Candidatus Saccharibacteria bacterium]|nr:glycosyltransferase family 2 protein [Candidatus Saccharibacteria bacterium]
MRKVISVVVPVYNEEAGIRDFLMQQLIPVLDELKYGAEVILVNDGSGDKTVEKIRECVGGKKDIKLISFARNFGKEIALTAGLQHAKGDAVIMIDADGQHPVEMIPKMVEKWENGAQIVTAVRDENTTKHKMGSRIYYAMMRMFGNKNIVVGAMDFRLVDRDVMDEFNKMTERNRLTRGLIDWLGVPQEYIKVHTKNRMNGKPTYSAKRLMALTVDGLVSSSRTPLLIFGYIGLFITVVSLILGLFILIQQYIMGDPLGLDWSGAVAMSVFVSFLVGLVLISQAITAIYISQIHVEAKGRPLYVVDKRKSFGLDDER